MTEAVPHQHVLQMII